MNNESLSKIYAEYHTHVLLWSYCNKSGFPSVAEASSLIFKYLLDNNNSRQPTWYIELLL